MYFGKGERMNLETGKIKDFNTVEEMEKAFENMQEKEREQWVEINPDQITPKQKKQGYVSKNDHRSELAVIRDILRKRKRSLKRKEKKNKKEQK